MEVVKHIPNEKITDPDIDEADVDALDEYLADNRRLKAAAAIERDDQFFVRFIDEHGIGA